MSTAREIGAASILLVLGLTLLAGHFIRPETFTPHWVVGGVVLVVAAAGVLSPRALSVVGRVYSAMSAVRGSIETQGDDPVAALNELYKLNTPGATSDPPTADEYGAVSFHRELFQNNVPTYLLDEEYNFLDWNGAFELVFGHLQGVRRGAHVSQWAVWMANAKQIREHGIEVFGSETKPFVDPEPVSFESPQFGTMQFDKWATAVFAPEDGELIGWNVVLNVRSVRRRARYRDALRERLEENALWTRYATAYDTLLLQFPEYVALKALHCESVMGCDRVLDIGAGTGNVSRDLLRERKHVTAIESNEAMHAKLEHKCRRAIARGDCRALKMDIRNIGQLRAKDGEDYDGAVLMNVLYAFEEPAELLEKVNRLLRANAVITISAPHNESRIEELFTAIRESLGARRYESLKNEYELVRQLNMRMDKVGTLRRRSLDEMKDTLRSTGFNAVLRDSNSVYAGQGYFIAAQKTEDV